jgi:hypothetical protein
VSSELPCFGVLLGSRSEELVTIFNMRGHYAVPVCRYLDVDLSLNMLDARQRWIKRHFYSGYAWQGFLAFLPGQRGGQNQNG